MNWLEFWEWLTGVVEQRSPELPAPTTVFGTVVEPTSNGVIVQLDPIQVGNQNLPSKKILVPRGLLNTSRPGQRVMVRKNGGEHRMETRTQPHNRHYGATPTPTGVPVIPVFQGPQKFEFLWQPTLNRTDLTIPHFSSQQVASFFSEGSPRFSEPLDDLGGVHQHYLSESVNTAWRKINHQSRTAFQPDYYTGTFVATHYIESIPTALQLIPTVEGNEDHLPPPIGSRTVEGYTSGYPQVRTGVTNRELNAFFDLGETQSMSLQYLVDNRQGTTLDYQTGVETLDAETLTGVAANWREGTFWFETWRYLDPPGTEPRRWEVYRARATSLRVVMTYLPEYDGSEYVMVPQVAKWEGYSPETDRWWAIGNLVQGSGVFAESLANLSPGMVGFADDDWQDPMPTCNPSTGEFAPESNYRRSREFEGFYASYPTGNPPPDSQPPIEWEPGFVSPDLGGSFTIAGAETLYGYGEKLTGGSTVTVNGVVLSGNWDYWAALRHKQTAGDTQTLLLCNSTGITILLDLNPPQEYTWPEFWRALKQPEDLQFMAATSPFAHHSYPLEDAYIGATLDGQDYVLVLSHLNPWRDLSKQQWAQQGLKRPKTWEAYLAYITAGKPLPVTETGLVVSGVIPMAIPVATRPGYGGTDEPLGYKTIPLRMLPIPEGAVTTVGPSSVEILDWAGPPEGKTAAELKALQVLNRPGFPEDKPSIGKGLYRLTFPAIPITGISAVQFLGRGKGKLEALQTASGVPLQSSWTGYGLGPKTQGRAVPVSGWHPFSTVHPDTCNPSEGLTVTLRVGSGLQISQLLWTVTALQ